VTPLGARRVDDDLHDDDDDRGCSTTAVAGRGSCTRLWRSSTCAARTLLYTTICVLTTTTCTSSSTRTIIYHATYPITPYVRSRNEVPIALARYSPIVARKSDRQSRASTRRWTTTACRDIRRACVTAECAHRRWWCVCACVRACVCAGVRPASSSSPVVVVVRQKQKETTRTSHFFARTNTLYTQKKGDDDDYDSHRNCDRYHRDERFQHRA